MTATLTRPAPAATRGRGRVAFSYARISKDGKGAGLGVARQHAENEEYLARVLPGVRVIHFADNDKSGFNPNVVRPEFDDMLSRIREGEAAAVIGWHADRYSRQPLQIEYLIQACSASGAELHTRLGGHHSDPTMLRIESALSWKESQVKSERMIAKHAQMAERGNHPGGARRFGYTPRAVAIDEAEAAIIRDLAERALNGESLSSLARSLNAAGIPTATGYREDGSLVPWRNQTVRQLLLGLHLTGWRELHGKRYRANWPAILDTATHDALVLKLNGDTYTHTAPDGTRTTRPRRTSPGNSTRYLLSGIARCGKCGEAMRARSALYRCAACHGVQRKRADIDTRVRDAVVARLSEMDAAGELVTDETAQERAALMAEREEIPARRDSLAGLMVAGTLTPEGYAAAESALAAREAEIGAALALLDETTAGPARALRGATGPEAGPTWDAWTNDPTGAGLARQRAILALMADIVIHPAGRGARRFDPESVAITWRDIG